MGIATKAVQSHPPKCRVAGCTRPGVFPLKVTRTIAVQLCLEHGEAYLDSKYAQECGDPIDLVGEWLRSVIS